MTYRPASGRPAVASRRGFTLVELLVVITIISVLVTIVTVASVGFIGSAREAATRTTIKKVSEAIQDRVGAVNRYHRRPVSRLQHDWDIRGWSNRWKALGLDIYANTPSANDARLVISRKGMLLELLPVNQDELMLAYWFWAKFDDPAMPSIIMVNGEPVYYITGPEVKAMTDFLADIDEDSSNNASGGPAPGKPSNLDLPGEVFYYALLNAPVFGGQRVPEDNFRPSELVDTDEDGVPELGDAWEQPLQFYRWPTRLVNDGLPPDMSWRDNVARKTLMPNAPASNPDPQKELDLKVDPDDRAGYLSVPHPVWKVPLVTFFHDPNTWHAPLVVSAGPDGVLGLVEPHIFEGTAPAPPKPPNVPVPRAGLAFPVSGQEEALYDNITNHMGAAGGL